MANSQSGDDGLDYPGALRRRCAESYVEAWRRFGRMTGGSIEESGGATRIATGLPNAHFNPVFVPEPPPDPERVLGEARSFFDRQGVPWTLVTIGGARGEAAPLERAASAAGLERMSVNPGMVLAPIPEEEKNPVEELSVSIVDTQEELLTYIKVLAEGFETPLDLLAPLNKPESLGDLDVTRYIGRAGGQPVVTGLRTTANRVAVIFNVVTLPAWRRRGFGRAITMRAARDGIAEGCVASFLQSSIIGFSMYLHAGYRHVTDFHVWMLKSPQ